METGGGLLTTAMLDPIVDMIKADLGVLLPVGITLMGIMIGVSLVPRIVWKFL